MTLKKKTQSFDSVRGHRDEECPIAPGQNGQLSLGKLSSASSSCSSSSSSLSLSTTLRFVEYDVTTTLTLSMKNILTIVIPVRPAPLLLVKMADSQSPNTTLRFVQRDV